MFGSMFNFRFLLACQHSKALSAALCAAVLASSPFAFAQSATKTTLDAGTLVQKIAQSQQRLDAQRVLRANSASLLSNTYITEKAQCWLDFSRHEVLRNNPSSVPGHAHEKAHALVSALEAGDSVVQQDLLNSVLPTMPVSQRMRKDLWLQLDAIKATNAMICSAKAVGCAEVKLVQAAHLHERIDWRYARPYFAMAEDLVKQAQEQAKVCK
jgi:hypothetical protein